MKIPKYIDNLIDKRQKLAEKLAEASTELDEWLIKKRYTFERCLYLYRLYDLL